MTDIPRIHAELAVELGVDRIAASYVREKHLPALLRSPWGDTRQIVERLERALRAGQKGVARGHWAADANRLLAIRGALQTERATLVREIGQ